METKTNIVCRVIGVGETAGRVVDNHCGQEYGEYIAFTRVNAGCHPDGHCRLTLVLADTREPGCIDMARDIVLKLRERGETVTPVLCVACGEQETETCEALMDGALYCGGDNAEQRMEEGVREMLNSFVCYGAVDLDLTDVLSVISGCERLRLFTATASDTTPASETHDRMPKALAVLNAQLADRAPLWLSSPLLLVVYVPSRDMTMDEMCCLNDDFLCKYGEDIDVKWGLKDDASLPEGSVKVTLISALSHCPQQ